MNRAVLASHSVPYPPGIPLRVVSLQGMIPSRRGGRAANSACETTHVVLFLLYTELGREVRVWLTACSGRCC